MLTVYTLTPLGTLPGLTLESFAFGINDQGVVTGGSASESNYHGFYWQNGVLTDLGDLPGGHNLSLGNDVNDAGVVAGMSYADSGDRAIVWQSGVGLTNLGDLPGGGDWSTATGINNAGQVSGHSQSASGHRAFRWQSGGGMTDLGDLPGGGDHSYANGINNAGQVVGYSGATTGDRAYLWQSGVGMTDLGDLIGGDNVSLAYAVNDAGQVVGESGATAGMHAFLWDSATGMIDLGDLPGGADQSAAYGINNASQVVGGSRAADGERAFIWSSDTGMQDLNSLVDATGAGWRLTRARAVNNLGQIVGGGIDPTGVVRAFLLTPVIPNAPPVPSAGAPYVIDEGDVLVLDASATSDPDGDPLDYTWDINGDGIFGDATGVTPTLSFFDLFNLGITHGPAMRSVSVQVTDDHGHVVYSEPTTLTVHNLPPPIPDAGGPYVIQEYESAVFVGFGGDWGGGDFTWEINGNDIVTKFNYAVVDWSSLHSLGITGGPATYSVALRFTDMAGVTSISPATSLFVSNLSVEANAGGPYDFVEGEAIELNAGSSIDSDSAHLTFSWDLNNDGVFGDATGVSPQIEWGQFRNLYSGVVPDIGQIRLRATDSDGNYDIAFSTFAITAVYPIANIVGPAVGVLGETVTYQLTALDPYQSTNFTYYLTQGGHSWEITGSASVTYSTQFQSIGEKTVSVRVRGSDGQLSSDASWTINIVDTGLVSNAQNPGLTDLVWNGTSGSDEVWFEELTPGTVRVTTQRRNGIAVNDVQTFSGISGQVRAKASAGDDCVNASGLATVPIWVDGGYGSDRITGGAANDILFGGESLKLSVGEVAETHMIVGGSGNDTIYGNWMQGGAEGHGGNNLLVGGDGDDVIYGNWRNYQDGLSGGEGGGGRNIIVGGHGADQLYSYQHTDSGAEGGGKDSILISGDTSLSMPALEAIHHEWYSDREFEVRAANIIGNGSGPRNNGDYFLQEGVTVISDYAVDALFGSTRYDAPWNLVWYWYVVASDTLNRTKPGDKFSVLS